MSFSRINRLLRGGGAAGGGGGGGGLSSAQTAAIDSISLGDITDFTAPLTNYWQLGVPNVQRSGGSHPVTTYSAASDGLTMVVSHADTSFDGTNASKSVGFYRILYQSDFDVAIDVDNIANISNYFLDRWHVHITAVIGGTYREGSMFGARLESAGNDWTAARVISPSYQEKYDSGYIDSLNTGISSNNAANPPSAVRLRIKHSNADTGFKAFYSINGGASYTTLEGSNGGTGFFQMHTKDNGTSGHANRYSVGGPVFVLVTVGQSHSQTSSAQQGTCRVKFVDLS